MTIPEPYLPPPSQPWGRWVSSRVQNLLTSTTRFEREARNNLRQLNIAQRQPMRGLLWRQTSFTVTITTAGVYVPLNTSGTLDTDVTFNMEASGAPNISGLKNITDQTRTMVILASFDGEAGNNHNIGLKLALNGALIDGSECTSFVAGGGNVGKVFTHWILKLEPDDEITMYGANLSSTTNLSIDRFKMTAHAIQ